MNNPLGLIRSVIRKEFSNITGPSNINSQMMQFGSTYQLQDRKNYKPETPYVVPNEPHGDVWMLIGEENKRWDETTGKWVTKASIIGA